MRLRMPWVKISVLSGGSLWRYSLAVFEVTSGGILCRCVSVSSRTYIKISVQFSSV